MLGHLLDGIVEEEGRFVLIDVHSYNHRRDGPNGGAMPQDDAPDINIGTFSMPRADWAFLLDPLMEEMRRFDFNGRKLDVRENVAFQGKGEQARFVHERYPGRGCAIALEFKKFFMDEWTGEPDPAELKAMRDFITYSAQVAADLLQALMARSLTATTCASRPSRREEAQGWEERPTASRSQPAVSCPSPSPHG